MRLNEPQPSPSHPQQPRLTSSGDWQSLAVVFSGLLPFLIFFSSLLLHGHQGCSSADTLSTVKKRTTTHESRLSHTHSLHSSWNSSLLSSSCVVFLYALFVWDRVLYIPGLTPTHYVDMEDSTSKSSRITDMCHHALFIQCWRANLGLWASKASTLPAELHAQLPPMHF